MAIAITFGKKRVEPSLEVIQSAKRFSKKPNTPDDIKIKFNLEDGSATIYNNDGKTVLAYFPEDKFEKSN